MQKGSIEMDLNTSFAKSNLNESCYCYHGVIQLNNAPLNRRKLQQLATQYAGVGLRYSSQQDIISILCYRRRNDGELLEALASLAKLLPEDICYRFEAIGYDDQHDFGYLLYNGAIYRLNSLSKPSKPSRLVLGRLATGTASTELRNIA